MIDNVFRLGGTSDIIKIGPDDRSCIGDPHDINLTFKSTANKKIIAQTVLNDHRNTRCRPIRGLRLRERKTHRGGDGTRACQSYKITGRVIGAGYTISYQVTIIGFNCAYTDTVSNLLHRTRASRSIKDFVPCPNTGIADTLQKDVLVVGPPWEAAERQSFLGTEPHKSGLPCCGES